MVYGPGVAIFVGVLGAEKNTGGLYEAHRNGKGALNPSMLGMWGLGGSCELDPQEAYGQESRPLHTCPVNEFSVFSVNW